jgi:hypothetical protein
MPTLQDAKLLEKINSVALRASLLLSLDLSLSPCVLVIYQTLKRKRYTLVRWEGFEKGLSLSLTLHLVTFNSMSESRTLYWRSEEKRAADKCVLLRESGSNAAAVGVGMYQTAY